MMPHVLARRALLALALLLLPVTACGAATTPAPAATATAVAAATLPALPSPSSTPAPTETSTAIATATPRPPASPTTIATRSTPAATPTLAPLPTASQPFAPAASLWQAGGQEAVERLKRFYDSGVQGTIVERVFFSRALGRSMPYDLYLPPGYEASGRRYPVLYMLHGGGGHRDEWLGYAFIDVADAEFRSGRLPPLIIVMPQGDTGYWTNNAGGGPRWGDYLWQDLVAHIDAAYRTLPAAASRAIGGLSMGGWGALSNGFLHPDVFGIIGAHSASLPIDDGFRPVLGAGEEFRQKDPVGLARTAPRLDALKIWIDDGLEDTWLPRNNELHSALESRGIAHTWQANPGPHNYTYWMAHALDYLRFYTTSVAQP